MADRDGSTNTALVAIIVLVIIIIIALLYYFSGWGDRRDQDTGINSQNQIMTPNNDTSK